MKNINEEAPIKPVLARPESDQAKGFVKNFNKTMNQNHVKLNETDALLTEKEQSLKKKIFSLAKMEALVFADPKLAAVYDEMAKNGEEKYGYHYNETIQNMIFNDYVLNSPRYLEKYKMAHPLKKKRRDKSGINQMKKAGDAAMHKKPVNPIQTTPAVAETTGAAGGGAGAYAQALDYKEPVDETTTSASSGAYAGPAAWGGGDLMKGGKSKAMRKPIWQGGTIIQESNYLTDPSGFAEFINMLNEQTDSEFIQNNSQAYGTVNNMNPENQSIIKKDLRTGKWDSPNLKLVEMNDDLIEFDVPEWAMSALINNDYSGLEDEDEAKLNQFIQRIVSQYGNAHFMLDDIDGKDNLGFKHSNDIDNLGSNVYRLYLRPSKGLEEKAVSPAQQRLFGMAHAVQKGELSPSKVGGAVKKIAKTVSPKDVTDFASTKYDEMNEDDNLNFYQNLDPKSAIMKAKNDLSLATKQNNQGQAAKIGAQLKTHLDSKGYNWKQDPYATEILGDFVQETSQSIIDDKPDSVAKGTPTGTVSTGNVPVGIVDMKEEMDLLNEIDNELNAYSIHQKKLEQMSEERKPSSLVLKDRLGAENKANFKKDFADSDTKDVIDLEKELQWEDQQTDVPADPQKLAQDIEKNEIKVTKGEALKNVGNSTNDKGDEVPKRNLTKEEQDDVNLYRKGMHSWVYDNEPDKRFEDRMKADMGDAVYEIREKQMADFGKQPMYNKEAQPTEPTKAVRTEFDKEKSGWNDPKGLSESMISGRYRNALNKSKIIDFQLNEVKLLRQTSEKTMETLFPLDFTGLGNTLNGKTHDYKVSVNESVVSVLDSHKFFTDGKQVFAIKNPKQNLSEAKQEPKPPVKLIEEVDKMKHLLGYKPNNFVSTNNTKKNRGF